MEVADLMFSFVVLGWIRGKLTLWEYNGEDVTDTSLLFLSEYPSRSHTALRITHVRLCFWAAFLDYCSGTVLQQWIWSTTRILLMSSWPASKLQQSAVRRVQLPKRCGRLWHIESRSIDIVQSRLGLAKTYSWHIRDAAVDSHLHIYSRPTQRQQPHLWRRAYLYSWQSVVSFASSTSHPERTWWSIHDPRSKNEYDQKVDFALQQDGRHESTHCNNSFAVCFPILCFCAERSLLIYNPDKTAN